MKIRITMNGKPINAQQAARQLLHPDRLAEKMLRQKVAGVICDEIAFWPIDELSPKRDEDTLAALRPALLTLPHSKLIAITSPYARRGAAWNAYRKHFGQDASKVLVWQAPTLVMNPSADETAIAQAYEDDPDSAAAEYGAESPLGVEALENRAGVV